MFHSLKRTRNNSHESTHNCLTFVGVSRLRTQHKYWHKLRVCELRNFFKTKIPKSQYMLWQIILSKFR